MCLFHQMKNMDQMQLKYEIFAFFYCNSLAHTMTRSSYGAAGYDESFCGHTEREDGGEEHLYESKIEAAAGLKMKVSGRWRGAC